MDKKRCMRFAQLILVEQRVQLDPADHRGRGR